MIHQPPPGFGRSPGRQSAIRPPPAAFCTSLTVTWRRTLRHCPTEGHHPRSAVCPRHPYMPAAIEDRIVVTGALGTQVKIKSEVFRGHVGLHDANGNPRRDRCRGPVEKGHRHGVLGDRPLPNPSFRSGTGSRFPLTMTSRARCPPLLNASAVVVPEHLQARHAHCRCDFCMRGRTPIYTAPDRDAERCLSTWSAERGKYRQP
jgi:hypothetical protein